MPEERQIACCLCDRWHALDYVCYDTEVDNSPDCQVCGAGMVCRGHVPGILVPDGYSVGVDPAYSLDQTGLSIVATGPNGVISHIPVTPREHFVNRMQEQLMDRLGVPPEMLNPGEQRTAPILEAAQENRNRRQITRRGVPIAWRSPAVEALPTIQELAQLHPLIREACGIDVTWSEIGGAINEEQAMPRLNRDRLPNRDTTNVPLRSALDVALANAAARVAGEIDNIEQALHTARATPQVPETAVYQTPNRRPQRDTRVQEMAIAPPIEPMLIYPRQSGRTSVILAGVEQSPDAVFVAHSDNHAQTLRDYNPDIANRILGPMGATSNLLINTPIIYDHTIYEQAIQYAKANPVSESYRGNWYAVCGNCRKKFDGPTRHQCRV